MSRWFGKKKEENGKKSKKDIPNAFEIKNIGTGLDSPYAKKLGEVESEGKEKYAKDPISTFYGLRGVAIGSFDLSPRDVQYEPKSRKLTISKSYRNQIKSDGEKLKENLGRAFGLEKNELVEKLKDVEKRLGIEETKES